MLQDSDTDGEGKGECWEGRDKVISHNNTANEHQEYYSLGGGVFIYDYCSRLLSGIITILFLPT